MYLKKEVIDALTNRVSQHRQSGQRMHAQLDFPASSFGQEAQHLMNLCTKTVLVYHDMYDG